MWKLAANPEVDDLSIVPEDFRPLYVQDGDRYKLNPELASVTKAIDGLNTANAALRKEVKDVKASLDLSPLKEFGDTPQAIAETVAARLAEYESLKGQKVEIDKVRSEAKAAFQKELEAAQRERDEALRAVDRYIVEAQAVQAIVAEKGIPDLVKPFVVGSLRAVKKDDGYQVVVVDRDGDVRVSPTTGQPLTPHDLVKELKSNEVYGRLFESDAPSGGGAAPGAQRANGTIPQPQPPGSAVSKIARGLDRLGR